SFVSFHPKRRITCWRFSVFSRTSSSGQSAFVKGVFLGDGKPEMEFHMPGRVWHMQKVLFERYWMRHWF
ncbi:MAG: hypothetical protein JRM95_02340, partial [Nitrososphaerota archaeon]|nr:hypothetical protein [Nitrososphaerota archaeon]